MKELSSFFDKYKKITPPDYILRDTIVSLVEKHTSIILTRESVTVRSFVVYVSCSSILKSEIFLHKESILKDLHVSGGSFVIQDIR